MAVMTRKEQEAAEVWRANVPDGGRSVDSAFYEWAGERSPRLAYASGRRAWCGCCGGEFPTVKVSGRVRCPHCGRSLDVRKSRAITDRAEYYLQELVCWGEYQVVRTYIAEVYFRKGERRRWFVWHAYDWMLREDGAKFCFSRRMKAYPNYRRIPFSLWDEDGREPMVFRKVPGEWQSGWNISGYYPVRKVQKWAEKYGMKGGRFLGLDLYKVVSRLICGGQHFETVWKERDGVLCRAALYAWDWERLWPSVKIARRHGYRFREWKMWADHLWLLESEGYDIRNPLYICPGNLRREHDRILEEREARMEREWRDEERREKEEEMAKERQANDPDSPLNVEYRQRWGAVLGVEVVSGDISIRPLQDVGDFFQEGRELHHCVFANEYYSLPDSLILGARVGGKRTETIELNLRTMEIEQCRGKNNLDSKWHRQIYELMEKSVPKFRMA